RAYLAQDRDLGGRTAIHGDDHLRLDGAVGETLLDRVLELRHGEPDGLDGAGEGHGDDARGVDRLAGEPDEVAGRPTTARRNEETAVGRLEHGDLDDVADADADV